MLLSPKRPETTELFSWDCRRTIESGNGGVIQEVVAIFEENATTGLPVPSSSVGIESEPALDTSQLVISVMLSGGTVGQQHRMTAEFITTMGERLFHRIEFDCRRVILG